MQDRIYFELLVRMNIRIFSLLCYLANAQNMFVILSCNYAERIDNRGGETG